MISILMVIIQFFLPLFNIFWKDLAIYVRNAVFYGLMYYYYYKQETFTLPVINNPFTTISNFFKNLQNPKEFFKSLGENVLDYFKRVCSLLLFVFYFIIIAIIFITYDNFNLWDVFGDDYAGYAEMFAFCSILFALGWNGFYSITDLLDMLYTTLKGMTWNGMFTYFIKTLQLLFLFLCLLFLWLLCLLSLSSYL